MTPIRDSRPFLHVKHLIKTLLGKPSVPPVIGVADAGWYDQAYRVAPEYAVPYHHSHYYAQWALVAERVRHAHLTRVVDIGCGPGQFAQCLFEMAGITAYDGLDFSGEAVRMAQRACPQGRFHQDDATTTDLCRTTPHDVVICMEILEHVPQDEDVIRQWVPGIRAIATVPNFPYQSHVRHFTSSAQVIDRYARYFDDLTVLPMRGHYSHDRVFYIMDGIRNTTV